MIMNKYGATLTPLTNRLTKSYQCFQLVSLCHKVSKKISYGISSCRLYRCLCSYVKKIQKDAGMSSSPPPQRKQRARSFPVPKGRMATGGCLAKLALSARAQTSSSISCYGCENVLETDFYDNIWTRILTEFITDKLLLNLHLYSASIK